MIHFQLNKGPKIEHKLFSSNFLGAPGISRQKSRDVGRTICFPWVSRPVRVEDPHPTRRYPDQKVWVWVPCFFPDNTPFRGCKPLAAQNSSACYEGLLLSCACEGMLYMKPSAKVHLIGKRLIKMQTHIARNSFQKRHGMWKLTDSAWAPLSDSRWRPRKGA